MSFELRRSAKLSGDITVEAIKCHCGESKELASVDIEADGLKEFYVCMACLKSSCQECYGQII